MSFINSVIEWYDLVTRKSLSLLLNLLLLPEKPVYFTTGKKLDIVRGLRACFYYDLYLYWEITPMSNKQHTNNEHKVTFRIKTIICGS